MRGRLWFGFSVATRLAGLGLLVLATGCGNPPDNGAVTPAGPDTQKTNNGTPPRPPQPDPG